jgi:hypothetical protein
VSRLAVLLLRPLTVLLPVLPMLLLLTVLQSGLLPVLPILLPVLWPMLLLTVLPVLLPLLLHVLKLLFQQNGQHLKANLWPIPPIQGHHFSRASCEWPS